MVSDEQQPGAAGVCPSGIRAELFVRRLLILLGEDVTRPGLLETPRRVIEAWAEWTKGMRTPAPDMKLFTDVPDNSLMIVEKDILFYSICEHHLAPFFGVAHVAYIPTSNGVVGLSKLARAVDWHARRLQVQERLTNDVANFICDHVAPDVGVRLEATHFCMCSRGVKQQNAKTITTALRGEFYHDAATRAEFLKEVRNG